MSKSCHMCGMPSWPVSPGGHSVKLHIKAAGRFQRDRRLTVWCCSRGCALLSRAVAQMGPASHNWPVTLKAFAALDKERSDRYETPSQAADSKGPEITENGVMGPPHMPPSFVTRKLGGRPRDHASSAERQRAYRNRKRGIDPEAATRRFTDTARTGLPPGCSRG